MSGDEEKPTRRRLEWNLSSLMKDSLFSIRNYMAGLKKALLTKEGLQIYLT